MGTPFASKRLAHECLSSWKRKMKNVHGFSKKHDIFFLRAVVCVTALFLYKENHSLGEWFQKGYADEEKQTTLM